MRIERARPLARRFLPANEDWASAIGMFTDHSCALGGVVAGNRIALFPLGRPVSFAFDGLRVTSN